ncbi:hypothetical protein KVQ90_24700, partial [Escherichia coli]|nr:hypothetical protein [Escherichia coli]
NRIHPEAPLQLAEEDYATFIAAPVRKPLAAAAAEELAAAKKKKRRRRKMIYDVNSPLFRSFLSQKGGASSDKRKMEEQKPKDQRFKANENKPVMNE